MRDMRVDQGESGGRGQEKRERVGEGPGEE